MATEGEAEEKVEESFDPISEIMDFISRHLKIGDLPFIILVVVIIYNFFFFRIGSGYEIYTAVPIILVVIVYFTKYWETSNSNYEIIGIISISLAALFDLFVSIVFIYGPDDLRYLSIPTLLLDLFALYAIYQWRMHFYHFKVKEEETEGNNEEGKENK